jgi:tRNA (cytidine/uridine-2'-O-)-methyltransferase
LVAYFTSTTKTVLHLVVPLGYALADRYLKRAGLDYWPFVDLRTYDDWDGFDAIHQSARAGNFKYFSTHGEKTYLAADYRRGDFLVFGSETKGLGAEFLASRRDDNYRIQILEQGVRSLNLANSVSLMLMRRWPMRPCWLLRRGAAANTINKHRFANSLRASRRLISYYGSSVGDIKIPM